MDTKEKILEVAQGLVQTIGANAMSYQHVSEAVGIRKASIHHHFPTKEDLLDAVIDRYSKMFMGLVDGIVASKKSGASKLRDYCGLFESTLRESCQGKVCAMGMLGAEVSTLGPGPAGRVKKFYSENDKRLSAILEAGRKDGTLQFEGNTVVMAGLLFGLLEGAMLVARGRENPDHFGSVTDQLLRLLKP